MQHIRKTQNGLKAVLAGAVLSGCSPMFYNSRLPTEAERERISQSLADEKLARPVVKNLIGFSNKVVNAEGDKSSEKHVAKDIDKLSELANELLQEDKYRVYSKQSIKKSMQDADGFHTWDGRIYLAQDANWSPGLIMHEVSHSESRHTKAINEYVDEHGGFSPDGKLFKLAYKNKDFPYLITGYYFLADQGYISVMDDLEACLSPENMEGDFCEPTEGYIFNPASVYSAYSDMDQKKFAEFRAYVATTFYPEMCATVGLTEDELVSAYDHEGQYEYFQEYLRLWHEAALEQYGENFFEQVKPDEAKREMYRLGELHHDLLVRTAQNIEKENIEGQGFGEGVRR